MGQYWSAVLLDDENGMFKVIRPFSYKCGSKLKEHAYLSNPCCRAVMQELADGPKRVAWIGDYSNYILGDEYEKKLDWSEFMEWFNAAWDHEKAKEGKRRSMVIAPMVSTNMAYPLVYLVNHTAKQYINLNDFRKKNTFDTGAEYGHHKLCYHPLPILTACGNGRGGGDIQSEYAGKWAFDEIEVMAGVNATRTALEKIFNYEEFLPIIKGW